ncbi:unnamed protein product [Adineta steineri]|uniref:NAD(P)(+)--arginine ADP-ribosyltransferase n=1 Tax=Adineta steineri TaxID=433720 RepID=A0A813MPG2_9BILA|nr:unnamed protein product [Adineta steineri]CAF0731732.1 unnamed protein product [Adineta steineri]CAF3541877.1 unnamed protein product [Adineta steineri]CAF4109104.1 unnamed protein product [Adineta steineri]
MSGSRSSENAVASSKPTVSSNIRQPRQRMAHNYLLLWEDISINQTSENYENTLKEIRSVTGDINVFTQRDECIDFLTDAQENIKSFLVVKDIMSEKMMSLINDIPQLHTIYIFDDSKILSEKLMKKWRKIKSIHTNIDDLCQALRIGTKRFNQDSVAMSFITVNEMAPTENLNQLEPSFMYTQLFKEILLDMEHNKQAIKDFIIYCRDHDCVSPKYIDRFEKEYHAELAIWWYTCPSNIYSMLNYALRCMEGDTIINMGFFIHDLHQQIQQLHQQQVHSYPGKTLIVYRGQGLSIANFEKLKNTEAGLMSFNNFLSTSTAQDVALELAYSASENMDMVGILFKMSINPSIKSSPFASIKEKSYFKEEDEILFSMHTIFRVVAVRQLDKANQLYQVELQLTSDDDQQLRLLTDRIRKEAGGSKGWERLGRLLITIGQLNKAEELYNVLLEQTSDESKKAIYCNQLGYIKLGCGDHKNAIWYYEQGLQIQEKTLSSNHPEFTTSYNNIGSVYNEMGEYSKALSIYEEVLEIQQKRLPSTHPDLAISYNNIGGVYHNMGEYTKALSFYEKVIQIRQKNLPSNHPDLAQSYNNIGGVYGHVGEYSKALSSHEKAAEIREKTLPSNHPDLAQSYSNIGIVYGNMREYSKALSFYEKALQIQQKTLLSNHPFLAILYNNIGSVYNHMVEHSKALSFYEKALEIQQKTLPSNHPSSATSYNHIGNVYEDIEEYSKALASYEKALKIIQKTLPSNHPDLAITYNNIGLVYIKMREYSKALLFHEKALEIQQKTLSPNHPDSGTAYNNIGNVYYNMKDYSKALSYYERALNIFQRALIPTHPHIKNVKNVIEIVKKNCKE